MVDVEMESIEEEMAAALIANRRLERRRLALEDDMATHEARRQLLFETAQQLGGDRLALNEMLPFLQSYAEASDELAAREDALADETTDLSVGMMQLRFDVLREDVVHGGPVQPVVSRQASAEANMEVGEVDSNAVHELAFVLGALPLVSSSPGAVEALSSAAVEAAVTSASAAAEQRFQENQEMGLMRAAQMETLANGFDSALVTVSRNASRLAEAKAALVD